MEKTTRKSIKFRSPKIKDIGDPEFVKKTIKELGLDKDDWK